jgi:Holliday junction resolvase
MVRVLKSTGELEEFRIEKVEQALMRSGAPEQLAGEIARQVSLSIYDKIPTNEVYKTAYSLLKEQNTSAATRFGLKEAIMRLGPAGFTFEKYIARVLAEHGFGVKLNVKLRGACADEETDILAAKDGETFMVECKYHNERGYVTGLKEALYTWARYDDLTEAGEKLSAAWIVTNTKLSSEAVKYCTCKGVRMTAWGYPPLRSLQDLIDCQCIYPITILTTLPRGALDRLARKNILLIQDLRKIDLKEVSRIIGCTEEEAGPLARQIDELAGNDYDAGHQQAKKP